MITQIDRYHKDTFSSTMSNGKTARHDVYQRGSGDKVVVIIQELPGIGQETLSLADEFISKGYKVVLPHLFGPIGKISMLGNMGRVMCMRKEISLFAKNESSPVVDWLKALCRKVQYENKVKGVAVIGMCLSGNFAISLMADDSVLASFASQPAMPVMMPAELHMSPNEVKEIRNRLDKMGPMMCARFEGDWMCTGAKFKSLSEAFNSDGKERIKLLTLPGKGHSVITMDFVDKAGHPTREALDAVFEYFDERLTA